MKERAPVSGIHEAALYVADLDRAERFWHELGLEQVGRSPHRHVFFRAGDDLLLIFDPRTTAVAGGRVPPHGTIGAGHVALSVPDRPALETWRARLEAAGVSIETELDWPTGGRSLYFRDPDGNSLEIITSGSWGLPSR